MTSFTNRHRQTALWALVFVAVTAKSLPAQTPGRSSLLPNPVPSAGGRVNISDPQRGQGAGRFNTPRNGGRNHNGVDLTAPVGTPVQAAQGGVVIRSESFTPQPYSTVNTPPLPGIGNRFDGAGNRMNGAGNRVTIQHDDGTYTSYFHLEGGNQPSVGERVVPGQVIGNVGTSGNVPENADPHLHFEVRDNNGNPVEPRFIETSQPSQTAGNNSQNNDRPAVANPPLPEPEPRNNQPVVPRRQPGTELPTASITKL